MNEVLDDRSLIKRLERELAEARRENADLQEQAQTSNATSQARAPPKEHAGPEGRISTFVPAPRSHEESSDDDEEKEEVS